MAKCEINYRLAESESIPAVCAQCGEPATTQRRREFTWYPSWIVVLIIFGLFPFLIAALVSTKRMKLRVPFCEQHRRHFSMRSMTVGLGLLGLIVLLILIIVVIPDGSELKTIAGATLGILFIAWFVAIAWQGQTVIRATEITARDMILVNVHESYAKEIRQMQQVA
ncbi:MAG: hypothetical protein U0796_20525 [Gemmatales bacterium]